MRVSLCGYQFSRQIFLLLSTQSPGWDTTCLVIFLSWQGEIYFFSSTLPLIIELKSDLCGFSVRPFHPNECRDFSPALWRSLKVDYQTQQMSSGAAIMYNPGFQLLCFSPADIPLPPEFTCAFKIIVAILSSIYRCFKLLYRIILHWIIYWPICFASAPISS